MHSSHVPQLAGVLKLDMGQHGRKGWHWLVGVVGAAKHVHENLPIPPLSVGTNVHHHTVLAQLQVDEPLLLIPQPSLSVEVVDHHLPCPDVVGEVAAHITQDRAGTSPVTQQH